MEQTIYKGQANIYNPATKEITKCRNWRGTFTKEQVLEWMERRENFLRTIEEYDDITWRLLEDGCYKMTALRNAKKSKAGRQLKPFAVCYIFRPVQKWCSKLKIIRRGMLSVATMICNGIPSGISERGREMPSPSGTGTALIYRIHRSRCWREHTPRAGNI